MTWFRRRQAETAAPPFTRPPGEYVVETRSDDGSTIIENLNGIRWYEADLPPRKHECWTQTKAWFNYFTEVQRCACGAIRCDGNPRWMEKNSTRNHQAKAARS